MDRAEAVEILKRYRVFTEGIYHDGVSATETFDLAIEALERETEYGQMVVDFTKGDTMKSDEWKYDTTCNAESATTTDCDDCIWNTCNYNKVDWEVSEDCISRQALIDEILEDGNGAVLSYTKGMDEDELVERIEKQMVQHFIGVIEYAPPVTPTERTGEWIPVSERLPEVGQDVIFCDEKWTEEGCLRADGDWWQFRWGTIMPKEKVTAWMPLPDAYEGGDTE